ncbi:hypothetical protein PDIDSM_8621 [Penicillium digitatum]|nr:hypothetical protein PDIDSM_8621 [Penicillium digitatum]
MANPVIRVLSTLDSTPHAFIEPRKKIHETQDVSTFLTSKAYTEIMTWVLQLNRSMFPLKLADDTIQTWSLNSDAIQYSAPVRQLQRLLSKLEDIIQEVPPDTGPRRFGNISFRRWSEVVESRASDLLKECLPADLLDRGSSTEGATAETELKSYFLGSWGSGQRLDYGTGHELSFLAFLGGLWKLNGFPKAGPGVEERAIVIGVIHPYLELTRLLIKTYNLEPAGSHGVWGLDDHSFAPYVFGSAQLSPAINDTDLTPEEGSLPNAPDPGGIGNAKIVERERQSNLYFSAIGFIYDVKRGPFWEHSPMLFDISGIRAGWGKINKGMIKMYNAEVLSKFPVVQHFPFGSRSLGSHALLRQIPGHLLLPLPVLCPGQARRLFPGGLDGSPMGWGKKRGGPKFDASWCDQSSLCSSNHFRDAPGSMAPTRAPWSARSGPSPSQTGNTDVHTKAPWANDHEK